MVDVDMIDMVALSCDIHLRYEYLRYEYSRHQWYIDFHCFRFEQFINEA